MVSDVVKSFAWKCDTCVVEERWSPGFEARELATTQQLADGRLRTVVWHHRRGGPITSMELIASTLRRMSREPRTYIADTVSANPGDPTRRRPPKVGTVLGPGEEVVVPCGRRHGGERDERGTWQDGQPGYVRVSFARFMARVQQIASG